MAKMPTRTTATVATGTKAGARPKSKPRRRPEIEHQSYFGEVVDWRVSYGLMKGGATRHHLGPYWEHVRLTVLVKLFFPERLARRVAEVGLLGERETDVQLDHPAPEQFQPNRVGTFEIRGDRMEYLGGLPLSSLWGVMPALAAGKIKVMRFHGEIIKRRQAAIWSMGFDHEIDPDEIG